MKDADYLERRILLHDGPFVTHRAMQRKLGMKKQEAAAIPKLMIKLQEKGLGRFVDCVNKSRVFFKILPHEYLLSKAALNHLEAFSIDLESYRYIFSKMDQNLSISSLEKFKAIYPYNSSELHIDQFYPDPSSATKYFERLMNRAQQPDTDQDSSYAEQNIA